MRRRDFVKDSLLACGGLAFPRRLAAANSSKSPDESPRAGTLHVKYVRNEIPAFEIPPYRGQYYDDRAPDTLDIAERAKLAINCLTSITDPAADYQIYWVTDLFRNPPVMAHQFDDYVVQIVEGFLEDLPLLRLETGEQTNSHIDRIWVENYLKCIGPDGLFYMPLKGEPWTIPQELRSKISVWRANGTKTNISDESVQQFSTGQICARPIALMTLYYLRDKNPMWKQACERMIQRIAALTVDKGDYCYVPGVLFEPNAKVSTEQMPLGLDALEYDARLLQGLSQYYTLTGYEPARELARKLMLFFRDHSQSYDKQGRFLWADSDRKSIGWGFSAKDQTVGGHGGGHIFGLSFLVKYATAVNDQETLQFVKTSFEWAKNPGPEFGVSSLVGWFPEWYLPGYPTCETCCIADMLALAVNLSLAGVGDYWDDVDRWARNQFAEQQMTSVDWVYRMAQRQPHKPVASDETADRMPERNLGGFGSWATGNDWTFRGGIMQCCMGHGGRALYFILANMVQRKGSELCINLLLNRASRWADVYSYVPHQGRVDIKMKEGAEKVLVRAPEWVRSGSPEITCTSTTGPKQLGWEERYVNLGAAKPGEVLTVKFPISERTVHETIGLIRYTLKIKGNTVVSIDPPGQNGPLYERAAYRTDQPQWRTVKRFIPEEQIQW
jgi:hypothetical protein